MIGSETREKARGDLVSRRREQGVFSPNMVEAQITHAEKEGRGFHFGWEEEGKRPSE